MASRALSADRKLTALTALAATLLTAVVATPGAHANNGDGPRYGDMRQADVTSRSAGLQLRARQVDVGHLGSGERRSSGGGTSRCTVESVSDNWVRTYQQAHVQDDAPDDAIFYWLDCPTGGSLRYHVPTDADPGAPQFVDELVQEAFNHIHTTTPTLLTSPAIDRPHLVGLPTWLAVDPADWTDPPTGSAATDQVTITAWLEPDHVTYDLGTGDQITCTGPGNRYATDLAHHLQTPDCSYTYTHTPSHHSGDPDTDTYTLTATITYIPRYRIATPTGTTEHTLDPLDGPPATTSLTVHELRAVRTTNL